MKLIKHNANASTLITGGQEYHFSYETIVGITIKGDDGPYIKYKLQPPSGKEKWSRTTMKHMNTYFELDKAEEISGVLTDVQLQIFVE